MGYDYTLLRDAYFSTGGFANGAYLTKHKRETDEDYRTRQSNAYYLNYFSAIVNALVDPIFKRKPLRDYDGGASVLVEKFLKDVDGAGTDITSFMKRAAIAAKTYGIVFIVLDNVSDASDRENVAELLRERAFPYAYIVPPENVDEYGLSDIGGLDFIKFHEIDTITDGTISYRYIRFDREGWAAWGTTMVKTEGTYSLGRVPVIPLFSHMLEQQTMFPAPELLPIAKTAKALYNHCSWLDEILRNQTFPLLTMPSLDASELVIGTNNALGYSPDSSHTPAFIAPDSSPASTLQGQIHSLIQEMYRMANLSFMTGAPSNVSGVARQWEFERTNQALANFAHQCGVAEEQMMQVFAGWLGTDIEYTVSYPEEFGIVDIVAELAEARAVLELDLADEMREEVLKKVLGAYLPNLSDERFDEIVEDGRKKTQEAIYMANAASAMMLGDSAPDGETPPEPPSNEEQEPPAKE